MPTVLDWFGLPWEEETNDVVQTDKPRSLLPILEKGKCLKVYIAYEMYMSLTHARSPLIQDYA